MNIILHIPFSLPSIDLKITEIQELLYFIDEENKTKWFLVAWSELHSYLIVKQKLNSNSMFMMPL